MRFLSLLAGFPGSSHDAYIRAHRKTRAVVERMFGLLKTRFRCLDHTGGALQYDPKKEKFDSKRIRISP
ncbi:putative nuclease HARBI1 [Gastrophryne carolinensis]